MGKVHDIKEKAKKLLASPVYSTIVLVPLLIVVILVSAAVFMAAENTGNDDTGNWRYYDAVYYIVTLVTTIGKVGQSELSFMSESRLFTIKRSWQMGKSVFSDVIILGYTRHQLYIKLISMQCDVRSVFGGSLLHDA